MSMNLEIILFMVGQAIIVAGAIVGTYVKTAVRLTKIELLIAHSDGTSQRNHDDIVTLKSEVHDIRLKLEHMETMQSMLCSTCPLKGDHHRDLADQRIKK